MSDKNKQLVFTKERELHWREITTPTISDRDSALVRPIAVARSDLDAGVLCPPDNPSISIKNLKQDALSGLAKRLHLDRYSSAAAVGQQCIAEVVETGPDVSGLPRGKRVVVTRKLSCGTCQYCLSGATAQCQTFTGEDLFGLLEKPNARGGLICDLVRVPNAAKSLVPLPDSLNPLNLSSAGADLGDAWCSVIPQLQERKATRLLVLGGAARSTALYAVALAAKHNVATLDYLDQSAERVALALKLGANAKDIPLQRHRGSYDVIVSGNTEPGVLRRMLGHLVPGGVYIQLQPQTLSAEKIPLSTLYANNLSLVATKSHVLANLRAMLEFLAVNAVDLESINTHLGEFELAHEHFAKNTSKVVVHRAPLFSNHHATSS